MSTPQRTRNWINLNDPDGAVLQAGQLRNGKLVLVLSGIPPRSPKFQRALTELKFSASASGALMVRTLKEGEPIPLNQFSQIWEDAKIESYPLEEFLQRFRRDIQGELDRAKQREDRKNQTQTETEEQVADRKEKEEQQRVFNELIKQSQSLGLNESGNAVYTHEERGRFIKKTSSTAEDIILVFESDSTSSDPEFLRANNEADTERCLRGLVHQALSQNEPVYLQTFAQTILGHLDIPENQIKQWVASGLENAALAHLLDTHEGLIPSWDDALKLQDLLTQLELSITPLPLMLQAQRFIEKADSVALIGNTPLASFSLLNENTVIHSDTYDTENLPLEIRPQLVSPDTRSSSGALLYADANTPIEDLINKDTFSRFNDQALAVLITEHEPDEVLNALDQIENTHVVQFISAPTHLTQTKNTQYLCLVKRGNTEGYQLRKGRNPVPIKSWDELRSISDETLTRIGREDLSIFNDDHRAENVYQRPYMAFSQVGPATTMTPKNIQGPLNHALGKLEAMYGPIDGFVSGELGLGFNSMAERFSAEQVDAIGLGINSLLTQRGIIIGDQTGVGKGRVLAALATWANMNDKPIIFVTDKSFLFSDLARDLQDIEEWSRFRPLITNAGGSIVDIMGDGKELVEAPSPEVLSQIMQGKMPSNHNIIFTTYSQMNIKDSEKSRWLLEQSKGAVLILDEAHVGAGSNSNVSRQIEAMTDYAEGVVYSSATWAKDHKNLSIYKKVLPESVNIHQVESWLESEGQAASEVFSSMLAMDGVFVRREHDSSQVKFQISVDENNQDANREVVNQISKILGSMAMLSGETDNMIQRMNSETRKTIQDARNARLAIISAIQEDLRAKTLQYESLVTRNRDNVAPEDVLAIEQEKAQLVETINELKKELRTQSQAATGNIFKSGFGGTGKAISTVMRRAIASLSVPHAARLAIEQLENDRKPIISLEETGGSFINQIIEQEIERITNQVANIREAHKQGELTPEQLESEEIAQALDYNVKPEDLLRDIRLPTIQDMMLNLIDKLGIVKLDEVEVGVNEDNERILTESNLSVSDFVQKHFDDESTQEFIEKFNKGIQSIQEEIKKLPPLPISPFDALSYEIRKAGYSVGEISGRKFRIEVDVERSDELGYLVGTMVKRKKSKEEVVENADGFNNGRIDVLMFNQSAATGMSVHSSPRFKDPRQRVHIQLQDLLNALLAEQTDGRSNRRGQLTPPIYLRPTLGLASEQRIIMAQNMKRRMLAAIVRSSGDNPSVIKDVPDLLSPIGDRVTQEYLLENSGIMNRLNLTMADLERPYGLARRFTQLLVLLGDDMSTRILDDLEAAYHDAQIEDKITNESKDIDFLDIKAEVVESKHAWGPKDFSESMSYLDAPVVQKTLVYTENLNPLFFDDVIDIIADSSAKLSKDERVKRLAFNPIQSSRFALHEALDLENRSPETKEASLGFITISSLLEKDHHKNSKGKLVHLSLPTPGTNIIQNAAALISSSGLSAKIWLFAGLNPSEDPVLNQDKTESFIVDLSKAEAIKQVLPFTLGLNRIDTHTPQILGNQELRTLFSSRVKRPAQYQLNRTQQINEWALKQANERLVSAFPHIPVLDLSGPLETGLKLLEAKKIIGLSSVPERYRDDIETALSDPSHNAVKEAFQRSRFMEKTFSRLQIGMVFSVDAQNVDYRYRSYFGGKTFLITGVHLPEKGHEGSLVKWKLDLVTYGAEKPVTISASTLYRMQKHAQNHDRAVFAFTQSTILYAHNERLRLRQKDSFGMFRRGQTQRTRVMLEGNSYQASQWAIASDLGRPVIYSDEKGGLHRAIEVSQSALHQGQLHDIAKRLHGKEHVKALITRFFENKEDIEYTLRCERDLHHFALNFESAIKNQQNLMTGQPSFLANQRLPDSILFVATGDGESSSHAIDITLKAGDRASLRQRFLSALERARQEAIEAGQVYLGLDTNYHRIVSIRGNKNEEQRTFRIIVPSGTDWMSSLAREQIIDAFIEANGAELISIPHYRTSSRLLEEELDRYYEKVNQPNEEKHQALIERFQKRQEHQALMGSAFEYEPVENEDDFSLISPKA